MVWTDKGNEHEKLMVDMRLLTKVNITINRNSCSLMRWKLRKSSCTLKDSLANK